MEVFWAILALIWSIPTVGWAFAVVGFIGVLIFAEVVVSRRRA